MSPMGSTCCPWGAGARTATVASIPPASPLPSDEPLLVRRAQRGDRASQTALVERYWDRLYRWLYHLTRDRHRAEDLAQDTFLKALCNLERFEAGTNFGAWLFRIGHNNYANSCRGAARRRPLPEEIDELPDPAGDPALQAESREELRDLTRALHELPAEFRAALLLRAEQGLSFKEIAGVLGLTEETARWRVFKARKKLLALLAGCQGQEKP